MDITILMTMTPFIVIMQEVELIKLLLRHTSDNNHLYVKKYDTSYIRYTLGCIGMTIPFEGYTFDGDGNRENGVVHAQKAVAANGNFWERVEIIAGFIMYASSSDVTTTYGQPSPSNRKVYVDTIDLVLHGEVTSFTINNPIKVADWVNVAFKYTLTPNTMFSVQVNGEKFQVFGNPSAEIPNGQSVVDTICLPLSFPWAWNNTYGQIPNAIAYDDIAINNNVSITSEGEYEYSDSDNIIPGFIRCTGLELTSEVAGNNWNYEGSDAIATITGEDDVRLYTDSVALNRYKFSNIPASLTGLESINIGVKNANISFPSKVKYIGFGLETGDVNLWETLVLLELEN